MKHIDHLLRLFVSDNEYQREMNKIVNDKGVLVATDAHILVTCPESHCASKYDAISDKYPAYARVIPEHDRNIILLELTGEEIKDALIELPRQVAYSTCDTCEGDGEMYSVNRLHSVDCTECDGTGHDVCFGSIIPCPTYPCEWENNTAYVIKIGEAFFDPNLLLRVLELPIYLGSMLQFVKIDARSACIAYVDDIMVLVMPMKIESLTYHNKIETIEFPLKSS